MFKQRSAVLTTIVVVIALLGVRHARAEMAGGVLTTPSGASTQAQARMRYVAAGDKHTCVVLHDGSVKCFGSGLFGQLGAHHLKGLKQGLPKAAQPAPGEANAREGAYRRLFPEASGANRTTPKPDDVEWLKLEFKRRIEASGLVADRDDNRAHPFEREKGSGSVGMLELDEIEAVLTGVEELLNDLSLLARRSNRPTGRVPGFTQAACDLVDLVLGGSVGRMWEVWGVSEAREDDANDDQWWWQYRAAYYQRIHDAHDARAEDAGTPLFNDLPREASLP